jgi:hypothetical protein
VSSAASEVAHRCACCGLKITAKVWESLSRRGYQDLGDPDSVLELRACTCGTTRSREVSRCKLSGTRCRRVIAPVGLHPRARDRVRKVLRALAADLDGIDLPNWGPTVELELTLHAALAARYESGFVESEDSALSCLRTAAERAEGTRWAQPLRELYRAATTRSILHGRARA